ncbi:hypothetical protein V6N13_022937 [Hibiscus sabdariffa]
MSMHFTVSGDDLLKVMGKYHVLFIVEEISFGRTAQRSQYLHGPGYTKLRKVGCTQPRRVVAISATARFSQEIGVKLGHEDLLDEPVFASYNLTMVNEAHERIVLIDILFRLVKDIT